MKSLGWMLLLLSLSCTDILLYNGPQMFIRAVSHRHLFLWYGTDKHFKVFGPWKSRAFSFFSCRARTYA